MLECYHLPRQNAISFDPIVARSHIFVDSFGSGSPLPFYWEIDFTMVNQISMISCRRCGKTPQFWILIFSNINRRPVPSLNHEMHQ